VGRHEAVDLGPKFVKVFKKVVDVL
jgi:hypothetical protein